MPADEKEEHLSDTQIIEEDGVERHDLFKFEANRLNTFNDWPQQQPNQSSVELARAGFIYCKDKKSVQCFECGGRIDNWSPEDIPFERHLNLFPNCLFVKTELKNKLSLVNSTGHSQHDSGNSSGSSPLSSTPPNMSSSSSGASSDESEDQFLISPTNTSNDSEFRELMKSETNRLNTFYINNECIWPVPGLSPVDLARSGFYYLHDDKVKCPFCTGMISNWAPGLRPLEEHSKNFPLCPFIMEEDVGNIPINTDPIHDPIAISGHDVCGNGLPSETIAEQVLGTGSARNSVSRLEHLGVQLYSGPKTPDMGPLDIRKASFNNIHWDGSCPVSSDRLAEAGFYYLGNDDVVKCFHCDLGLAEWEEGDDPWVEHAKRFPECNFLKLNRSQSFLDECRRMAQNSDNQNRGSISEDTIVCRIIDQWLSSGLTKEFLSLNLFPYDLVKLALNRRYWSHKKPFDSFADLYDAVSSLNEGPDSRVESMRQSDNPSLNVIEVNPPTQTSEETSNIEQSSEQNNLIPSSSTSDTASKQSEKVENPLKNSEPNVENRLLCKLCYLNEIQVVFLACGHQLACSNCAQRLTNCPVCRQPIRGYVRTFFS